MEREQKTKITKEKKKIERRKVKLEEKDRIERENMR